MKIITPIIEGAGLCWSLVLLFLIVGWETLHAGKSADEQMEESE